MTSGEIPQHVRISQVWTAPGGEPPNMKSAMAFRRNTRDRIVALHDDKGAWYDHAGNEGRGFLTLVRHVRGRRRHGALRWIADQFCIRLEDREWIPEEREERGRTVGRGGRRSYCRLRIPLSSVQRFVKERSR